MPATVLFLHGLIHACRPFGDPAQPVGCRGESGGARVLAPDLPGFGENAPGTPTSISRWLDDVGARMDALGGEPVHLAGHSVGGAAAMLFAHRHPERVRSVVNLEGNFTLADAFWSRGIARGTAAEAEALLAGYRADPRGWLEGQGIEATPERLERARTALAAQSGHTMWSLSRSIVEVTGRPAYLEQVAEVVGRGTPVHLVAGSRTAPSWDVPDFVRRAASSDTVLPGLGHMMMLEDPDATLTAVCRAVAGQA